MNSMFEGKDDTNKYSHNLEFSKIELQYAINSEPIEFRTIPHTVENDTFQFGTKIEIKVEDLSDFENDLPLVEISKKKNINEINIESPVGNKILSKRTPDRSVQIKEKAKSIKKKSEKTRKQQIKKPKEVKPRSQKCEGKVRIVVLSEHEMLEDRKLDASNSRYLKLPYKCDKCITAFDHELNLIEHLEKRHKKEPGSLVCNICESVLNTKLSFEEHYKRHYRRYECMACGKRNNNVYSVLKHYNDTHGKVDMSFTCKLCDFTTESHRSYRYHRDKHRTAKVECQQCGNTFVNKAGLRVHMLTVHKQSSRIYSCEPCGKVYRTKSGLSAHMTFTHADTAPAYCVACDLSFRSEWGLRHHLKTASRHISEEDK
ncbi:jg24920, partial [Pararge aegeria aegeria]